MALAPRRFRGSKAGHGSGLLLQTLVMEGVPPVEVVTSAPYMGKYFGVGVTCVALGNTPITTPVTYSFKIPKSGFLLSLAAEFASNAAPGQNRSGGTGLIDIPCTLTRGKAKTAADSANAPSVPNMSAVL